MHIEKEKALAAAKKHHAEAEAYGNEKKLTKEYLQLMKIKAFTKNTKMYLGPSIPKNISNSLPIPVEKPSSETKAD